MLQPVFGLAPGLVLDPELSISLREFGGPLRHFSFGVGICPMDCDFELVPEAEIAGREDNRLRARISQSIVRNDLKRYPLTLDVSQSQH
jgi:hypothetical protein